MKKIFLSFIGLALALYVRATEPVVVTRLSDAINTVEGSEYVPVISADGKTLLFCGQFRDDSIGAEDIYISHLTDEGWSQAAPLRELSTPLMNEAPLALSADGTQMILFQNGFLCTSSKTAEGWSAPTRMPDKINISAWQADAMISSDGKAMLFAAKKKGAYEPTMSVNIFVSLMDEEGHWGEPIDLGPTINTARTDRSPMLHPDMRTLYFSTNGRETTGGLDVYMSTRLREDSWTEWSEPVSLGNQINTPGADCWYKISTDGSLAYFAKEEENGLYDLYSVSLPKHLRPTPVATISGKLTDTKGQPVVTIMRWEDLETHQQVGKSQTDPADGSFFIVLPEGKNYGYYIDDETFFPIADNVDLRDKHEAIRIENNIIVITIEEMIEEQIPMPLNNLFFATNEWTLQPSSVNELERVVGILNDRPHQVEIGGHTDNIGSEEANEQLSQKRAEAVRDWLVEHGIAPERLTVKGYGESQPIATNETAEGRSKNRRVEIKFIK